MVRCFPYLFVAAFIFISCESEAKKEQAKAEREKEIAREDSIHKVRMIRNDSMQKYDLRKNENFQKSIDSVLKHVSDSFETVCKKDRVCLKDAYEKRKLKISCDDEEIPIPLSENYYIYISGICNEEQLKKIDESKKNEEGKR
jgi:hypothetical protein